MDWSFEIERALSDTGDWFTSDLIRLIAHADPFNRERIRAGFPEAVAAWEAWKRGEDPNRAAETSVAFCLKCGLFLIYFPDPDDDEARNWSNLDVGSYCPADGLDHEPDNA